MLAAPQLSRFSLNFAAWKASLPVQAMFRKLGLEEYLAAATSWQALRVLIVDFNDPDEGRFVKLCRQCDGVCSSGERVLLHAICYVCDFAWLADEFARGKGGMCLAWQNMNRAGGEWQLAVAACIAAEV
jgi:hypothetical protein